MYHTYLSILWFYYIIDLSFSLWQRLELYRLWASLSVRKSFEHSDCSIFLSLRLSRFTFASSAIGASIFNLIKPYHRLIFYLFGYWSTYHQSLIQPSRLLRRSAYSRHPTPFFFLLNALHIALWFPFISLKSFFFFPQIFHPQIFSSDIIDCLCFPFCSSLFLFRNLAYQQFSFRSVHFAYCSLPSLFWVFSSIGSRCWIFPLTFPFTRFIYVCFGSFISRWISPFIPLPGPLLPYHPSLIYPLRECLPLLLRCSLPHLFLIWISPPLPISPPPFLLLSPSLLILHPLILSTPLA